LALVASSASASKIDASLRDGAISRDGKSLLNTFPFNNGRQGAGRQAAHHGDHHDHHDHHGHHDAPVGRLALPQTDFAARNQRQGGEDEVDLSIGAIAAAAERCIDKVVMQETTEYDDVITCKHSYSEKCHTTYTTDFEPQQEEECEETFTKSCFIEYKKKAEEETIQFCHTPLICEGESEEEECKTVYESQCETRFHEHEVEDDVVECEETFEEKCVPETQGYTTEEKCSKWPVTKCSPVTTVTNIKHTPETECKKVPRQLCGPGACIPEPGPEECFDKKETVVIEVPEETCNLEPQKSCKFVTKLVPFLSPQEECVDIPKEVCSRSRQNPRTVQKPVVKKWCYVPSEESGLA